MMTAITTIVGPIPLARSGATVAGVYIDSIAVAVIGGGEDTEFLEELALQVVAGNQRARVHRDGSIVVR